MSGDYEVGELHARILELEGKIELLFKHPNVEYLKELSEADQRIAVVLKKRECA